MDILLKLATRERPDRAVRTALAFMAKAGVPPQVRMVVSVDEDDPTIHTGWADRLAAMPRVRVCTGRSANKVEAINRDLEAERFDVVVAIADDMEPITGWDNAIRSDMASAFPNLDGALHYNDGFTKNKLCTMPVIGWNLYQKFRANSRPYIYHPSYKSLWCDNEQTELFKAFGRLRYIDRCIVRHRHPSHPGGHKADDLLVRTEGFYAEDQATFNTRRDSVRPSAFVGFDASEISLSIGICTIPPRRGLLDRLLSHLNRQINAIEEPSRVEIVLVPDGRTRLTVGSKRQAALSQAKGRFIAFIDDDDWVADDYIARIIKAIDLDPEADCMSLIGEMTTSGRNPKEFVHSILYQAYTEDADRYYRPPNHLNPIRLGHAKAIGFAAMVRGEDTDFAMRLARSKLLKRETAIPGCLYHYRFDPARTATQRRR